jgi:glycine/D-amino acid oxidase-like deaminating enzyme
MDAAEVARHIGTGAYVGGWKDERRQPASLKYCRGLAQAAQRLGVAIHGGTPVARLERRTSGWRLHAHGPHIDAERVVLATNGIPMTCGRICASR